MAKPCALVLETTCVDETRAAGCVLAQLLIAGDVVALVGDLGAGKTAFVQGLAAGLGITVPVTSPTFVLINRYRSPGGCVLQHVDCYRLSHAPMEMWDVGLADLFADDDIVVIEWADRIAELLPEAYLEVGFTYLDERRRRLCFVPNGEHYTEIVSCLSATKEGLAVA